MRNATVGWWIVTCLVFSAGARRLGAAESPVAWIRFSDASSEYKGTPYRFLGAGDIGLRIDARPAPGRAIELLWGAKGDTREAVMHVNGAKVPLKHGGHDGFEWLRVPVPPGATGECYEVSLAAVPEAKAAFLAELRLVAPDAPPPAKPPLSARAHRITETVVQTARGEAFPEMRARWDREPPACAGGDAKDAPFVEAERNARLAAEGFYRCRRYVDGWLAHADPATGLIPENLSRGRDRWNGRNSAADNYPFMVLSCAFTDRALFDGRMRDMLRAEEKLTSRLDRLGDWYAFSKRGFEHPEPDIERIVFDNAEYVKDGLIPVTEWLGPSPWSERMIGLIEDIWKHAPIDTPSGRIPTLNFEVNGDLLQACARLFWFTGERKFLEWAARLGDYYLLADHHPTRDFDKLRFSDHDCEVINGLSELYFAASHAWPEKKAAYRGPMHALYDRVLEIGRNPDGLLWHTVNPRTGENNDKLCDTWGYNYDGIYTVFLVDGVARYRDAVRHVLSSLGPKYHGTPWADKSQDGIADSVEGALNLYNREPIPAAAAWIDHQTREMWNRQQPDGTIERWHGDGNFARTTLMYCLWKTQGLRAEPWRDDLRLGAVRDGDGIAVSLAADKPWSGRIVFDKPRHRLHFHLPADYPRINQFPEWFTPEPERRYRVADTAGRDQCLDGRALHAGLPVTLEPARESRWRVAPAEK